MTLDRRHLLAATPGDAAIGRCFYDLSEHILTNSPETATNLGLDVGARAALKSRLSDATLAHRRRGPRLMPRQPGQMFDDLLVKTGATPLTVLGDVVDGYIRAGGRVSF